MSKLFTQEGGNMNTKFKELVDTSHKTIPTIAKETGLNSKELQKAYRGEEKLTTQQILKLSRYFNVSASTLTDNNSNNALFLQGCEAPKEAKSKPLKEKEECELYISKKDYDALMEQLQEAKADNKLLKETCLRLAILMQEVDKDGQSS